MTSSSLPGLVLILGAALIPLLRGRLRRLYLLLLPLVSFVLLHQAVLSSGVDAQWHLRALGHELTPVRFDQLSLLFAALFHLALFLGTVFALHVEDATQHVAAFVYGGSAIGAVFAGDLVTLFVYWEVVGLSSTFLIWARRTNRAYAAGMRYLLWQIVSGVLLLAGALSFVHEGQPLTFGAIALPPVDSLGRLPEALSANPGGWLIFLAIGIKCAFPGLHTWLTDAYPEATPTGTVFLSSFTTKLAVYALIRAFAGTEVLIGIGAVMAGFPIFYAVIENDLRRVLAYSLINQVGFMVVGVGIGSELGLNGACAHAFADVIFKGLLFMAMGAVLHRTGRITSSELGGLWKSMPFTCGCCIVGAASISAFPLFSAFATKSLIMTAAAEGRRIVVWLVLLFAAAGVFHHAGIKIPFFAFFAHDAGLRPKPAPWNMRVAMGIGALLCLTIANPFIVQEFYGLLPHAMDYQPYTSFHVVSQLQLLFFSALAFVTLMLTGLYPPELRSVNLDADWIWRRLLLDAWRGLIRPLSLLARGFRALVLDLIPRALTAVTTKNPERGPFYLFDWLIMGSSLLFVVLLLAGYLIIGLKGLPR
jgi:multicomponent Na+:H+ antiporter subunit D